MLSLLCLLSVEDGKINKMCVIRKIIFFNNNIFHICDITKTCLCNIQRFFSALKIENFIGKFFYFFLNIFAQNIHFGYTLEPPH